MRTLLPVSVCGLLKWKFRAAAPKGVPSWRAPSTEVVGEIASTPSECNLVNALCAREMMGTFIHHHTYIAGR